MNGAARVKQFQATFLPPQDSEKWLAINQITEGCTLLANHARDIFKFAVVSAAGLALDFGIFIGLLAVDFLPFAANSVSATCAVSFVYFASVRRIFRYRGRFLFGLFLAYVAYQAIAVAAASLGVAWLAAYVAAPVAKVLILPLTFGANYAFMSVLTGRARMIED
jgi:hypothetical protein